MDDQKRDDKSTTADEKYGLADKVADGELSDDEMSDATGGYSKNFAKKPDEDAGTDGRAGLP